MVLCCDFKQMLFWTCFIGFTIIWTSQWHSGFPLPLLAPQNVTIVSRNFSVFATWLPADGMPAGTLYDVNIRNETLMWKPITSCTNISAKECNITCHIDDCYHKHEVEVRASADGNHSSWTKSNSFTLFFDVDFGPPVFKLEANNGVLHITPSVNEPQCISKYIHSCFEDVTFDLLVKDHDKEASYKGIEKTLEINETKLLGNVCVIAKSFHFTSNKSSLISEPKCHFIHKEGLRNWYSILTASLVIIAIIAITVFTVHYKSAFVKRLPKLLLQLVHEDFPKFYGFYELSPFTMQQEVL